MLICVLAVLIFSREAPRIAEVLDVSPADDPYETDPGRWGASLATLAEVLFACLDAAEAKYVVEVGAYARRPHRRPARRASASGGRVAAIDPDPQPELAELAAREPGVELVRELSLDALGKIERPDAIVLDGDHNYYTVSEELRLIAERGGEHGPPTLLSTTSAGPTGGATPITSPDAIPAEHRQPLAEGAHLSPGEPGRASTGLPYKCAAAREGGTRNGVATAIEDFVEAREDCAVRSCRRSSGSASSGARSRRTLPRWRACSSPGTATVVDRLEANRVLHLASALAHQMEAHQSARAQ